MVNDCSEIQFVVAQANVDGRSKSKVTKDIMEASRLIAVGCFCIGTNQGIPSLVSIDLICTHIALVDLVAAREQGIAVFNSPFQNSRSVGIDKLA